ncbi:MAG: hypothetical protein Q9184_005505 [Pyrenodesmia sp. 2 TL-2023]
MLLSTLAALALGARLAHAFTDTSPFIIFSTSELLTSSPQIVSAAILSKSIIPQLSECPSDTYIIVTQPGVHAEDYSDGFSMPYIRRKIQGEDDRIRSSMSVTDVLGTMDTDAIVQTLESECRAALLKVDASSSSFHLPRQTIEQALPDPSHPAGSFHIADDPNPRVIKLDFPAPPADSKAINSNRLSKLQENDMFLQSLLDLLPTSKYTVIYITTPFSTLPPSSAVSPVEPEPYEMDTSFSSQAHMELKRDMLAHSRRENGSDAAGGNVTLVDGPLFERYAFLSPGIFMGLLIALPLFLILYVGVSGVGSLQVSYAAFDREMGPAAQKKGQQ